MKLSRELVWPGCLFVLIVLFMLLVVDAYLIDREHRRREKAFEKDRAFLSKVGEVFLEDYFHMDAVEPQFVLRRLQLSATVVNWTHDAALDFYYTKCAKDLRKAAPNLQTVDLYGGYVLNPANQSELSLAKEFAVINRTVGAIVRSLTVSQRLNVEECSFDAIIAIDRNTAEAAEYSRHLAKVFDFHADRLSAYHLHFTIPLHFDFAATVCALRLRFDDAFRRRFTSGRSRFVATRPAVEHVDRTAAFDQSGVQEDFLRVVHEQNETIAEEMNATRQQLRKEAPVEKSKPIKMEGVVWT
ncbi:hypothetical protein M3Y99_00480700 [Aphelenchoides fujianensis]|nr:hypothetical protein M3Y99_00480700 [Aphelenchoides fujianensis]